MNIKFSIKAKFFIIILVPALILITVIYLDYEHLSSLGRSAENILSKNYKTIRAAQQIRQLLDMNRNRILMSLFQEKSADHGASEFERNLSSLLNTCKDNITEVGEKQIIDNLFNNYLKYKSLYLNFAGNTARPIEVDQTFREFLSLTALLISELNDLVLINEKAMETAEQQTLRDRRAVPGCTALDLPGAGIQRAAEPPHHSSAA